jgi:hypothetical protein
MKGWKLWKHEPMALGVYLTALFPASVCVGILLAPGDSIVGSPLMKFLAIVALSMVYVLVRRVFLEEYYSEEGK